MYIYVPRKTKNLKTLKDRQSKFFFILIVILIYIIFVAVQIGFYCKMSSTSKKRCSAIPPANNIPNKKPSTGLKSKEDCKTSSTSKKRRSAITPTNNAANKKQNADCNMIAVTSKKRRSVISPETNVPNKKQSTVVANQSSIPKDQVATPLLQHSNTKTKLIETFEVQHENLQTNTVQTVNDSTTISLKAETLLHVSTTPTGDRLADFQLLQPLCTLFGRRITKFPGALPKGLERKNAHLLSFGYCASLKADGERVFVFVSKNSIVLLRRDLRRIMYTVSHCFSQSFIFDAEIIPKTGMLLLFDTLSFADHSQVRRDYNYRVELLSYFLNKIVPKTECYIDHHAVLTGIPTLFQSSFPVGQTWQACSTLSVQAKPIYDLENCAHLWNRRQELAYECDGIIFTRLWCLYTPFADDAESVYKWKPLITVDFVVQVSHSSQLPLIDLSTVDPKDEFPEFIHPCNERSQNAHLFVALNNALILFSSCHLNDAQLRTCDKRVCEFSWDVQNMQWQLLHVREDKISPNTLHTTLSCLVGIRDAINVKDISSHQFYLHCDHLPR